MICNIKQVYLFLQYHILPFPKLVKTNSIGIEGTATSGLVAISMTMGTANNKNILICLQTLQVGSALGFITEPLVRSSWNYSLISPDC